MTRILKYLVITLSVLLIIVFIAAKIFLYKVQYGFEKEQTEKLDIEIPDHQTTILLFSKTTGFRHGAAIQSSKKYFKELANNKGWFLYDTEDSGIFNKYELLKFDVVIWNNSTGICLNDEQRDLFQNYVENGGAYLGIHGSGDFSHHWPWYRQQLIGAEFSHHPLKNQIQETMIYRSENADSTLSSGLPASWRHNEEWYIFLENPKQNGFELLLSIDGTKIDPDGSLPFMKGNNFGMGKNHPVAWYKNVGKGKSFYTSIGHQGEAFNRENIQKLLENAVEWAIMD